MESASAAARAIRRGPWQRPHALARRREGIFLYVRSSAASVLLISPVLAKILWVSSSQARNSAIVASGRLVTCVRIAGYSRFSLGTTWQHCGRAVFCPVSLRRDRTFET